MKRGFLYIFLFAILVLALSFTVSAVTQNITAKVIPKIYINEFEIDPPGVDGNKEWVELHNPFNYTANISGWEIYDSINIPHKIATIPSNTFLGPQGFFVINVSDLNNNGDSLTLKSIEGVIVDQTSIFEDEFGDTRTWQRIPDAGDNFLFKEQTFNSTNVLNITISNETTSAFCALETESITLSAVVEGSCGGPVLFSVNINGNLTNFTANQNGTTNHFAQISPGILSPSQNISWFVLAQHCLGHFVNGSPQNFNILQTTDLLVTPSDPDGLNDWYIAEPLFSFTPLNDREIFYRWNGNFFNYSETGPFSLEGTPNNGNTTGGTHLLRYWSNLSCGRIEPEQNFTGHFDFTDPQITDIFPEENEIITTTSFTISALLDEVYQSNSGINKSSVKLILDGIPQNPTISDSGDIDAKLSLDVNLTEGKHNITISVSDFAGRSSQRSWQFEVNTTFDILSINIFDPKNTIYNTRRIPFNLTVSQEVNELIYLDLSDSNPRERRLCRNCDSYGFDRTRLQNFQDGFHNLTIIARTSDTEKTQQISFFIDSRDPSIRSTSPTRGFANGTFTITFFEENPKNLTLFYGNPQTGFRNHELNLSECIFDRNYICTTSVDLSDYDEQEIQYTFTLIDIANNSDISRTRSLRVDHTAPIINDFQNTTDGRRVNFLFDITEMNFEEINYIDSSDPREREITLCRRLRDNVCDETDSFNDGFHNLTFMVLDEAGNTETTHTQFFIDSKEPRIRRVEPRTGFTNGLISVEFKEANPKNLTITFGNLPTGFTTQQLNLSNCVNDEDDYECLFQLNFSAYENQQISYYLTLADIKDQSDTTRSYSIMIDSLPPSMQILNYSIDRRRVLFQIQVDEPNFEEVNYLDLLDPRAREKRLCSRLEEGNICESSKTFSPGPHNLTLTAIDEAGNTAQENVFFIISS